MDVNVSVEKNQKQSRVCQAIYRTSSVQDSPLHDSLLQLVNQAEPLAAYVGACGFTCIIG